MFSRTIPRVLRSSPQRTSTSYLCQSPLYRLVPLRTSIQPWPRPRYLSTRAAAKKLFKENPFTFSLACLFIVFGAGSLLYTNYIYNHYIVGNFAKYPEPVANKLRRALFYSNQEINPQKAVEYYRQALAVADEMGIDPFCEQVLGIKIQLAAFLEKIHQYQKAIDVLEIIRADCLKWMDIRGGLDGNESNRNRVLGKIAQFSVKLGDLYSNEYIAEDELAEKNLIEAVEICLKEQKRREDEGVKEGEGPWLSNEGIGGALESLADHYEARNKHSLSAPLYLHALALLPQTNCHAVVLMNNLSISLALQNPLPEPNAPTPSRTTQLTSARTWANKALSIAAAIEPPKRNEECDIGCAVATTNLGEFAEMDDDIVEARRRFEEARGLSKGLGFKEGMKKAEEALRRIGKREVGG